jgi:hypothetical protein
LNRDKQLKEASESQNIANSLEDKDPWMKQKEGDNE